MNWKNSNFVLNVTKSSTITHKCTFKFANENRQKSQNYTVLIRKTMNKHVKDVYNKSAANSKDMNMSSYCTYWITTKEVVLEVGGHLWTYQRKYMN